MKRLIILVFAVFSLLGFYRTAFASIHINEVRISPTEDRFIELYNGGASDVNLTGWYLQRKTETGSTFSSLVSSTNFEGKTISAGSYLLITRTSKSYTDILVENLTLTYSNAIQLKNDSGDIVEKICWGSSTECSFGIANPGDTESINRISEGSYVVAEPSPEAVNKTSSSDGNGTTNTNSNTQSTTPKAEESPVAKVKIISGSPALMGVPVLFEALTTGVPSSGMLYGKYFWNFGDGDSKELSSYNSSSVYHTFYYEGEYTVVLEYYDNSYTQKPKAVDKILVNVVPKSISIASVGDETDFFIEVKNDTKYDTDISKWMIWSEAKSFVIPKGTVLRAGKSIIISPKVSMFSFQDRATLRLFDSIGTLIYDYGATIKTPTKKTDNSYRPVTTREQSVPRGTITPEIKLDLPEEAISANALFSETEKNNGVDLSYLWLALFIGTTATSVYYLRSSGRRIQNSEPGADFEIIDE